MNKVQLEESRINWMTTAIALGIATTFVFILITLVPEETSAYKQGFQDGQTNCNLTEDNNITFTEPKCILGISNNQVTCLSVDDNICELRLNNSNIGCVRK